MMLKAKLKKLFGNALTNVILIVAVGIVLVTTMLGGGYVEAFAGGGAIYRGADDVAYVALMFNVYGGTEYIDGILKVLDRENVKCTFFLGGSWVAKNPETAKAIASAGQEIGSHGYHHFNQSTLSKSANKDEIMVAEKQIIATCGGISKLFAPPSGDLSQTVIDVAESLDYKVIMWSRDTIDWRDKDSTLVYTRATNGISNGEFVLMHPTSHTLEALPKIINTLKQNGFYPVTVSKALYGAVNM